MILGYQASDKLLQAISVFFLLMVLFMFLKKKKQEKYKFAVLTAANSLNLCTSFASGARRC